MTKGLIYFNGTWFGVGGKTTEVDTEMSATSENAVQNKVIKEYIDNSSANIKYYATKDELLAAFAAGELKEGDFATVGEASTNYIAKIDTEMSDTSTNPVQNKVVKEYIDSFEIDIDDAVSDTSTNPVQNKIIKKYIDDKKIDVDDSMSATSTNPIQNKVVKEYIDGKIEALGEITYNSTEEKLVIPAQYITYNSDNEKITISII